MATEKKLIDEGEKTKIKTPMARIMVSGTAQNPYFDILYFNPSDKKFHVGFGSFSLEYVFKWLTEEFEIIDEQPTVEAVEVVRCKDCKWYRIAPIDNVPYCCHESGYCGEHMGGLFFCACGERKCNEDCS